MRTSKALEALFPGTLQGILCVLFHDPKRWWSMSELAAELRAPASTLRLRVAALSEAAVLRQKKSGNRSLYQPNSECSFYEELRSILAKSAPQQKAAATILMVEDEPATLKMSRILLESWGYDVLEGHGPAEALRVFAAHESKIRLVITDIDMPGMSGIELAQRLKDRKPKLRVIFISGYHDEELTRGDSAFLPKPFNPESLARAVRHELAQSDVE